MGKILFLIFGFIFGLIGAFMLYFLASSKYSNALSTGGRTAHENIEQARLLWPPYFLDDTFQKDFTRIQEKNSQGVQIVVYLQKDASPDETESLLNQLEVTEGVLDVTRNTLEAPIDYILNMTTLPDSKDDVRDYIIATVSEGNTEEIADFIRLQEITEEVQIKN
jgi:hypothetical protein